MFCSQCGNELALNARFCSICGLPINEESPTVGQFSASKQSAETPAQVLDPAALGTKWLKFWNYFSLPVGGVLGILMSLGLPALGIIMVPLSILQFVLAYGLHRKKLWAWQWNWTLLAITYISMLIPTPTPGHQGDTAYLVGLFVGKSIMASLTWMWWNYVYWKKRKGLFS